MEKVVGKDDSGPRLTGAARTVRDIFWNLPSRYELTNRVLTFGLDTLWRRRAAACAINTKPLRCLDVCTGTGEMAAALRKCTPPETLVVALDFTETMIRHARRKPAFAGIPAVVADVRALPFRDEHFDVITISFATRNINTGKGNLQRSFREFRRVLRERGQLITVETTQPRSPILKALFHLYVRVAVAPLGEILTGSRQGYRYLSGTIRRFYGGTQLAAIMRECGFSSARYQRLLPGIVAVHQATR